MNNIGIKRLDNTIMEAKNLPHSYHTDWTTEEGQTQENNSSVLYINIVKDRMYEGDRNTGNPMVVRRICC